MSALFDIGSREVDPASFVNTLFGNMHGGVDAKTEWLTPPEIIRALGPFDVDVCAPIVRPWETAQRHFTIEDNAFAQDWGGTEVRKWMNPPYQEPERACKLKCKKKRCVERGYHMPCDIPGTVHWMERLVANPNGIALIFARTETGIFFPHVWHKADGIFWFDRRLVFYNVDGTLATIEDKKSGKEKVTGAGAPSCLVAYGAENDARLRALEGAKIKCEFGEVGGHYTPARAPQPAGAPTLN